MSWRAQSRFRPDSWVSTSTLPLRDGEGRILGTWGISPEITRRLLAEREVRRKSNELAESHAELQRLEAEFRAVLETSPDAISWYDSGPRYRHANRAVEELSGVSLEEMVGHSNRGLGHPDDFLVIWEAALRRVLATGKAGEAEDSVEVAGQTRWFHSRVVRTSSTGRSSASLTRPPT